jgi:rare lipoprotein A
MMDDMKSGLIVICLAGLVLLANCSRTSPPRSEPEAIQSGQKNSVITGTASWYGSEFHGRRTANGEIYDMFKLTAAHQTLPFNTIVEVENLENRLKTLVRINDRGPFVKDRIIDLSLKAAKMLDMEENGTAKVSLRLIQFDDLNPKGHDYDSGHGYWLQAGAFAEKENARILQQKLNGAFPSLKFEIHFQNGYHKVVSGKIASRPAAEKWLRMLDDSGIDGFIKEFE